MGKQQNIIPLKELNLTNRFLFDEVMEDRATYQDVLEIIFGKEISLLDQPQTEKEFRVLPLIRSVRMDVFAMDEEKIIYNTEMQDTRKYAYTFEYACREVPGCRLGDGTKRIFLNTKGENADEVSEELVEFLKYIEDSTDKTANALKSERVKRVHNRVCKVKLNEEIGVKYMQAWEEKYYEREEGKEEGREEGRLMTLVALVCRKLAKGMDAADIADMLEEEESMIQDICDAAKRYAPDYDVESITDNLLNKL